MRASIVHLCSVLICALSVVVPSAPPQAVGQQSNPGGRWRIDVGLGAWLNLEVNGSTLSGTVEVPTGVSPIFDASIDGVTIRFKAKQSNTQRIASFEGIFLGDEIQFKRSLEVPPGENPGGVGIYGAQGPATFVAVRVLAPGAPQQAVGQQSTAGGRWRTDAFLETFLNLVVNGSTLSGTVEVPAGVSAIFDASIDGATIRFKARSTTQRVASFEGTVVGDEIRFNRSVEMRPGEGSAGFGIFGAQGPATFVAVRAANATTVRANLTQENLPPAPPPPGNAPRCEAKAGQADGPSPIRSLEKLANAAAAIVEGYVQSTTRANTGEDVLFVVTGILKGALPTQQILLRESLNGANEPLGGGFKMSPGQRYVLFLEKAGAEERPGVTRYSMVKDPSDKFCVESNKIRLAPKSGIESRIKDSNADKTIAEIRELVGSVPRPR